jgi:hypothetical protein
MDEYERNQRKRAKALRAVADHAEQLHAVAKKDGYVGAILRALHSYLREAVDTGSAAGEGPARRAAADQHVADWVEEDGVPVIVQQVVFSWASSEEELERARRDG